MISDKVSGNKISIELSKLGITEENSGTSTGNKWFSNEKELLSSISPVDNVLIAKVGVTSRKQYDEVVETALAAFKVWRKKPAPQRGEVVRQFSNKLRDNKEALGKLVSYEMGKSYQEGLGEVQEMIDICDFAVGLSRQLHGLTMHSERPNHRMYEQYHPLGIVGVISAFNFPVAVWAWNTALALVCGDVCIWKPSEKTPLCGIACQKLLVEVLEENDLPEGISCLINGNYEVGEWLSTDRNIALLSATGSIRMGKKVAEAAGKRLGKTLLELGGNNAIIVTQNADLEKSIPAMVFGAVGTCGQRCTSTRRLIIHESRYEEVKEKLQKAYAQIRVGDPLDENNHMGPLIDADAVSNYEKTLRTVKEAGGKMVVEGGRLQGEQYGSDFYIKPAVVEAENKWEIVQHETFAPILYIMKYSTLEEAIELQNGVVQGLSSAIMTTNMREMEEFLSVEGSDCGIANVNIGTSGAEIGGAFGGEKETGGGRESGSDAWKVYMRRQTNTINYGTDLPLAQGIKFDL